MHGTPESYVSESGGGGGGALAEADVVCALEVIEHVADVRLFARSLAA